MPISARFIPPASLAAAGTTMVVSLVENFVQDDGSSPGALIVFSSVLVGVAAAIAIGVSGMLVLIGARLARLHSTRRVEAGLVGVAVAGIPVFALVTMSLVTGLAVPWSLTAIAGAIAGGIAAGVGAWRHH